MTKEDIARVCHEVNKAYCESMGQVAKSWEEAPEWQKSSAIKGVAYHLENPLSRPADSHEAWLKLKLKEGWRYGDLKNEEERTHPCILPYEKLPMREQTKDYLFIAVVRALESRL